MSVRSADYGRSPADLGLGDQRKGVVDGRLVVALLVVYLVVSRLVADVYVLPVGVSLLPADAVLAVLFVAWALWLTTERLPFPMGTVGIAGSALLVLLLVAPYLNAGGMTTYEADGAERGLVRGILLTGLFLAGYHVASNRDWVHRILRVTIVVTVVQGVIAVYETLTGAPFGLLGVVWQAIGLELDPRGLRGALDGLDQRLTGELRAAATAPHPLVLAGLLTVGFGICLVMYLSSDSARARRRYIAAIVIQLIALGGTNQRTGFIAIVVVASVVAIMHIPKLPSAMPLLVWSAVGAAAVAAISPGTPRLVLNFFTGEATDHNYAVRMSKYDMVPILLGKRPAVGAGFLTSNPSTVIFDNAYLTQLIELGVIGMLLLVVFLIALAGRSMSPIRSAPNTEQPILAIGFVAAVTLFVTMTTFDVLSFEQLFPTCLMLMAMGAGPTIWHAADSPATAERHGIMTLTRLQYSPWTKSSGHAKGRSPVLGISRESRRWAAR